MLTIFEAARWVGGVGTSRLDAASCVRASDTPFLRGSRDSRDHLNLAQHFRGPGPCVPP